MEWMTIEEREHASTGNYQDYMNYVKNIDTASIFFNDHQYAMSQVSNEERDNLSSKGISDFNDWLRIEEKESSSRDEQNYKSLKTEEEECLLNRSPQDYLNWHKNDDRVVFSVIDHQYAKGMANTAEREHLTASPLSCSKDWVNIDTWEDALSKDHWDKLEEDELLSLGKYEDYMCCLKIMKKRDSLPTSDHQYAKDQVNSEEYETLPAWPISGPKEQITIGEFREAMSIEPHNSMDWLNIEEGEDLFTKNSPDYIKGVKVKDGDHLPISKQHHIMNQASGTEVSSDRDISFCKGHVLGEEGGLVLPRDHWNSLFLVKFEAGNSEPVRSSKDYFNWGKIEAGETLCTSYHQDRTDQVKRETLKDLSPRVISCTKNGVQIERGNWEPARNSKDYFNWGKIDDGEAPSTNNHEDRIDEVKKEKCKDLSANQVSCTKDGIKTEACNPEPVGNSKYTLSWVKMEKEELSCTNTHHESINKVSTREVLCIDNGVILEEDYGEPIRSSKDYLNWGKTEDVAVPLTNTHLDSIHEVKKEIIKDFPAGKLSCTRAEVKIEASKGEPDNSSKDYLKSAKMDEGEASSTNNHQQSIYKAKREKNENLPTRKVLCTKDVKIEELDLVRDNMVSKDWVKMMAREGSPSINYKNNASMAKIKVSGVSTANSLHVIDQVDGVKKKYLSARNISCSKHQADVEEGMESLLRNSQISSLWVKLEEVEHQSSSSCQDYTNWVKIKGVGELSSSSHMEEVVRRKTEGEDPSSQKISSCIDRANHEKYKETDRNPLNSMESVKFKKVEKLICRDRIDSVELVKSEQIEKTSGFDEQESVGRADSENGEEDSLDRYYLDSVDGETALNFTAEDTDIANPARKPKSPMHWNPPEVVALLDAVGTSRHLNSLVSSDRSRNTDAFTEISITLKKAGHSRTPAQCRNKMKTIRRLFHTKWITASEKSGEVATPFWVEHFSRVWALAGKPKYLFFKPPITNSV